MSNLTKNQRVRSRKQRKPKWLFDTPGGHFTIDALKPDEKPGIFVRSKSLPSSLIELLGPPAKTERSLSEDRVSLKSLVASVAEVVGRGLLSKDEGDVIIRILASRYLQRHVDGLVNDLFSKDHSSWLVSMEEYSER